MKYFSGAHAPLAQFCDPDNIYFRAACNAAMSAGKPIKRRVIRRISQSPHAEEVLIRIWNSREDPSVPLSNNELTTMASADLAWRTLVSEEVSKEAAWEDMSKHFGWFTGVD